MTTGICEKWNGKKVAHITQLSVEVIISDQSETVSEILRDKYTDHTMVEVGYMQPAQNIWKKILQDYNSYHTKCYRYLNYYETQNTHRMNTVL